MITLWSNSLCVPLKVMPSIGTSTSSSGPWDGNNWNENSSITFTALDVLLVCLSWRLHDNGKGGPTIDYIQKWRNLSLNCKERLFETTGLDMCTQRMTWGLPYILQGIKPKTLKELATSTYGMKLRMSSLGNLAPLVQKPKQGNAKFLQRGQD